MNNTCICCGEIIPEGRQVCPNCEHKAKEPPQKVRLIDANALVEKLQEHHDFFVDGVGGFRYLTPKDKARVDEITNCIFEVGNAPTVDAVPIAVMKRAIASVNAADQCDQAGRYDFELRNALQTVLDWYNSPTYKEHERSAQYG